MKPLFLSLIGFVAITLSSCSDNNHNNYRDKPSVEVNQALTEPAVQSSPVQDAPQFNVEGFKKLVAQNPNPTELEKALNSPNNGVNNLDLNNDGSVDFLYVSESAGNISIFDNDKNPAVNVCNINYTQLPNDQVSMEYQGNNNYCGTSYTPHSNVSVGDLILLSYLLAPRHSYYSPHHPYGYHPPYYHSYSPRVSTNTRTTTTTTRTVRPNSTTSTTSTPSRINSLNTKTTPPRNSISSASNSQRSFGPTNNSGTTRSTGFGQTPTPKAAPAPAPKPSSSYSRSSFGSSRSSSFGGRKR